MMQDMMDLLEPDHEDEGEQYVSSGEEQFFYSTIADFETIVRERGIGVVLAALDDAVLYELYQHLNVEE